jgi:hypothetical protein
VNALISNAVARGWISFPDPVAVPARIETPPLNAKRAWKLWNEGQSLSYVAKAIGVKKRAVWAIIQEGRP